MSKDFHPASERPLTDREGTSLRSNCVTDDGRSITWGAAANRFELYQEHAANANALVSDWQMESQLPYVAGHDRLLLSQLTDLRAGLRKEHRAVWTHVVTLTGEPYTESSWYPPSDYLNDLTASWEQVRKSLYSVLSETTWEYVRVFDVDSNGYPIIRAILFTTDSVDADTLYDSAVSAHVEHSPVASSEIHIPDRCIRQGRSLGVDEHIENNLSCFGKHRSDSWRDRGFNSLIWAMNEDRFSFSQGSSEHIDPVETDAEPSLTETE